MPDWDVPQPRGPLLDVDVPDGFQHRDDFISSDAEALLAQEMARLEFSLFEMRGVAARRRVAFFGRSYEAGGGANTSPLPAFLIPLRDKVAVWANVDASAVAMALINEYPPGAPIGWHRDAPQYDIVAGISLLSSCRMKFRPCVRSHAPTQGHRRTTTHEILLERRSAYLMTGDSRNAYEHHIPAVTALRYSITFRTVRV